MKINLGISTLILALVGSGAVYGLTFQCPSFDDYKKGMPGWKITEGKELPNVTYVPYDVLIFDKAVGGKRTPNLICEYVPHGTQGTQISNVKIVKLEHFSQDIWHEPITQGGGYVFNGGNAPDLREVSCKDGSLCVTTYQSKGAPYLRCAVRPTLKGYTEEEFPLGCQVIENPVLEKKALDHAPQPRLK